MAIKTVIDLFDGTSQAQWDQTNWHTDATYGQYPYVYQDGGKGIFNNKNLYGSCGTTDLKFIANWNEIIVGNVWDIEIDIPSFVCSDHMALFHLKIVSAFPKFISVWDNYWKVWVWIEKWPQYDFYLQPMHDFDGSDYWAKLTGIDENGEGFDQSSPAYEKATRLDLGGQFRLVSTESSVSLYGPSITDGSEILLRTWGQIFKDSETYAQAGIVGYQNFGFCAAFYPHDPAEDIVLSIERFQIHGDIVPNDIQVAYVMATFELPTFYSGTTLPLDLEPLECDIQATNVSDPWIEHIDHFDAGLPDETMWSDALAYGSQCTVTPGYLSCGNGISISSIFGVKGFAIFTGKFRRDDNNDYGQFDGFTVANAIGDFFTVKAWMKGSEVIISSSDGLYYEHEHDLLLDGPFAYQWVRLEVEFIDGSNKANVFYEHHNKRHMIAEFEHPFDQSDVLWVRFWNSPNINYNESYIDDAGVTCLGLLPFPLAGDLVLPIPSAFECFGGTSYETPSYPFKYFFFQRSGVTGGGLDDLDSIDPTDMEGTGHVLEEGSVAWIIEPDDSMSLYRAKEDATATISPPDIIAPAINPGDWVWVKVDAPMLRPMVTQEFTDFTDTDKLTHDFNFVRDENSNILGAIFCTYVTDTGTIWNVDSWTINADDTITFPNARTSPEKMVMRYLPHVTMVNMPGQY